MRERLRLLVGDLRVQRDVDLEALGPRGLREALEAEVAEQLSQPQRDRCSTP